MTFEIDGALYPDVSPPERLETDADRADFITRLCTAWDFGIVPDAETVVEVLRPSWRTAIDLGRVLSSASYHFLRRRHGLPDLPFLVDVPADIREDPSLRFV